MCECKRQGVREYEYIKSGIMGAPGLINVSHCNNDGDEEETLIISE